MDTFFHRFANVLALWTVLTLALVPTTGRLLGSAASAPGVAVHATDASTRHHDADHGSRSASGKHADCHYCVLALGLAFGLEGTRFPGTGTGAGPAPEGDANAHRTDAPVAGLGARGPPHRA